ncbi:MAG: sugar transferase [Saprospiraceae bacterium]|nr:sugar transferase [Saprospiraceae bacterium]
MYLVVKRFCDFTAALVALLVLFPLLFPIALLLKFTGEGYVFYLQERMGYRNRTFPMYKFATMLKDSPNMAGGYITLKKDPRLTPLGGFLRKSKINELPQLLNILFGHMSVVGPRPVMRRSWEKYPEAIRNKVYDVKPGLTGIGSIIFRDEEDLVTRESEAGRDPMQFYIDTIYPYKGAVEMWYQEHQSFWVDVKIIFLTAWAILFPKNELVYRWFSTLPVRDF